MNDLYFFSYLNGTADQFFKVTFGNKDLTQSITKKLHDLCGFDLSNTSLCQTPLTNIADFCDVRRNASDTVIQLFSCAGNSITSLAANCSKEALKDQCPTDRLYFTFGLWVTAAALLFCGLVLGTTCYISYQSRKKENAPTDTLELGEERQIPDTSINNNETTALNRTPQVTYNT